ncbi:MAG: epoxyqueuosine reductase QueH, partial [Candidatus Omnitrophota bacterium]
KKKGGFLRAGELAGDLKLYRQSYCGCIYSLEKQLAKNDKRQNSVMTNNKK